uniref:Uncharacterized protein n=1 Tax=Romanomermis culicivorax TaxID=13658 RepID=A0A915LEI8_ROMCU
MYHYPELCINSRPANRAHYYQPQRQCSSPGAVNFCGSGAVSASANLHKLLPNSKSDYLLRQQRLVPYSTSWCSQQPLLELEAVRDFYGVEEQRRIQQQQQHQQQIRKYSSPTRRRMSHSESAGSCVYGRGEFYF